MTTHFVTLFCPNCGGKFDVYDDMERFFCGGCGTAMTVERRGGTVRLAADESAKKIYDDGKTTGTPAAGRLQDERQKLNSRRQAILDEGEQRTKLAYIIGAAFLLIGFVNAAFGHLAYGFVFFVVGILTVKFARKSSTKMQSQTKEIDAQIALLESLDGNEKATVSALGPF